ncbi:UNVERIFIED_CONTAM: hypothetical protein K2H54_047456 [Gekko kuhli]
MYWKSNQMFVCKLDKDVPTLRLATEKSQTWLARGSGSALFHTAPEVSPEAVGEEDSCSSSAPLSPSSSPRSLASGSGGCAPSKCVCNSCGLEIIDKYLLKVLILLL